MNNGVKGVYLDKFNPYILITAATMKHINTGIPDPLYTNVKTMMTQEYHLEPPVTGDRLFTRDGTFFQFIKQYAARYKQFVSTVHSCHGSYPTAIIMWYQSFTIHSVTHGIYFRPYYCLIP